MAAYSEVVRILFDSPGNAGVFDKSNNVVKGRAGGRPMGAEVEFSLKLEGLVIQDARFLAYGCPHTIAAASRIAERLVGTRVGEPFEFDAQALALELDVPADKLGRILVIEDALRCCYKQLKTGDN